MNGYAKQQATALGTAVPQQAEAWALTTAARRLSEAKGGGPAILLDAVRVNWRLWTIFQSNLADPNCGVPVEIRTNLLSLSNFVDKRSVELLSSPEPAKVDVLININRQIAAGLLGSARPEPAPARPGPAAMRQPSAATAA